jgi:hypothetical protein
METSLPLNHRLAGLRRRVRILIAERAALSGGALAAAASLVLAVLDKFRVLRTDWEYLLALVAVGLAAGWVWGFWRELSDFDVARVTEKRLALKERLSSALALGGQAQENVMIPALLTDAGHQLERVNATQLFPRRFGRQAKIFLVALVVLAATIILPELAPFQTTRTRNERTALRQSGEKLVKLANRIEKKPAPQSAKKLLGQVALNMKKLGKDMQTGRVTRKEALVKLNKLEKQMQQADKEANLSRSEKSLTQAAQDMKTGQKALEKMRAAERNKILSQLAAAQAKPGTEGKGSQQMSEAQRKALEKQAQALQQQSPAQQMLNLDKALADKLAELMQKGDAQEAMKILQQLSEKMANDQEMKKLTPEEMKQLAEELKQISEALQKTDLDKLAKEMLEMAKAMQRGDMKKMKECNKKVSLMGMPGGGKGMSLLGPSAMSQMSSCRSSLQGSGNSKNGGGGNSSGKGTGPGDGMSRYDPNNPSNINRDPPSRIKAQFYDTKIPGKVGDQGESFSLQVLGEPDKTGKAQVPYYKVYSDYSKAAEHALNREEVPPAYKGRVKDYFDSLKPEGK